jgi:hypothetical protein
MVFSIIFQMFFSFHVSFTGCMHVFFTHTISCEIGVGIASQVVEYAYTFLCSLLYPLF